MLAHLLALAVAQPVLIVRDALPAQRGTVVQVKDGDTLVARVEAATRTGQRTTKEVVVRLHGIDAPERGQAFEDEAREALAVRVKGREVELLETATDRYGRMVAIVLVEGRDVGEELLRGGLAWAFRRYLGKLEGDDRYCHLEYAARAAQAGLWAGRSHSPPWAHRKGSGRRGRVGSERSAADCIASFGR